MDLATARERIAQAATEEAVFLVVQEHLAHMSEEDLLALPDELRPHLIRSADDVSRWALYFSRQDLTIPPGAGPRTVLGQMVTLFTAASWRIVQIAMRRTTEVKKP